MDYHEAKIKSIIREAVLSGAEAFSNTLRVKMTGNPYAAAEVREQLIIELDKIENNAYKQIMAKLPPEMRKA